MMSFFTVIFQPKGDYHVYVCAFSEVRANA